MQNRIIKVTPTSKEDEAICEVEMRFKNNNRESVEVFWLTYEEAMSLRRGLTNQLIKYGEKER